MSSSTHLLVTMYLSRDTHTCFRFDFLQGSFRYRQGEGKLKKCTNDQELVTCRH